MERDRGSQRLRDIVTIEWKADRNSDTVIVYLKRARHGETD